MKGVKCIKRLFYLVLFICAFAFISQSESVSAANLPTTSFDMYYRANQDLGYIWYNNIGFNGNDSISPGGGILQYRINTGTVTANANNGVIHFETNIVASSVDQRTYNVWYHLDLQNIITCAASVSGVSVSSKNLSYAVTNWTSQYGQALLYNSTLTFYGDVVLKGFTSGQQVYFTCAVGSDNYSFYYGGWPDFRTNRIYFEQNPMSISWTNNETDTLLNVISNQNETIINNQYQTNQFLTDNTPPSADTSVISGSAGWLPAGPVDSLLNLPVTLAQGILNVFTGNHECSAISLPLSLGPYNFNLDIPCMDSYFSLASVNIIWNAVGVIISAFVIYYTLRWLYTFVDETLSFRENNSGLWGGL